jgi:acetyl esterase/lipase
VFQQIQGSREMVERGYAVAATDYPGLGAGGETHPYLVGTSEARAVIDSVRAATTFPGVGNSKRYAVWGHSQGGQAALFTGIITRDYATELQLVGVAAAAPATELAVLLGDDINTSGGKNLTAMTLWSWQRVYKAPMTEVVEPAAIPVVNQLAEDCMESVADMIARQEPSKELMQSFLKVKNPADVEPWRALLAHNTPGPVPREFPVFLAQGVIDTLVRPEVTQNYMQKLCASGSRVRMMVMPNVNHGWAGRDSASAAIAWIGDRFAGLPAPSDCGAK